MAYLSHRGAPRGNPLSVEQVIGLRNVANCNAAAPTVWRLLKGRAAPWRLDPHAARPYPPVILQCTLNRRIRQGSDGTISPTEFC